MDGTVAEAVVLVAPSDPAGPLPRRLTFRIGLRDGTVTLIGLEPIDRAWYEAERERRIADAGSHAALMRCLPLPDGGELRLVPTRPSEAAGPPGELYGVPLPGLLRRRDAGAREIARYTFWDPDHSEEGRACSEALVVLAGGELRLRCVPSSHNGSRWVDCPWNCLGNTGPTVWPCAGVGADGLLYCQPP